MRQPVRLKVASAYPTHLPVIGVNITSIGQRLEAASRGNMSLKIYEPGQFVAPFEVLDAVLTGKLDAGYSSAGFWSGKMAASPLFSSIPFGPETGEYLAWMYTGNGLKLYQDMNDRAGYNIHVLICTVLPPETSGWFARPIESAADLKGLKIRFFGLGARVMEKLGASTSLIPGGEIFPALEKGLLDATEYSIPAIDKKFGFYKIVKYNYFPGWHQQSTLLELLINKDVWNRMDIDQQLLLEIICCDGIVASLAAGEGTQYTAMNRNAEVHGVHNRIWSPEMLATFESAWHDLIAEESAKDSCFKFIYFRHSYWRDVFFAGVARSGRR